MVDVGLTVGSLLTLCAFLGAYTTLTWAVGRRFGVALRSEEALAFGIVLICIICSAGFLASRVLTSVFFRLNGSVVSVPLSVLIGVLGALPVSVACVAAFRRRRSIRSMLPNWRAKLHMSARWALPAFLITIVSALLVLQFGAASTFRTDAGWRSDAVKELVWSDSSNVGRDPSLSSEHPKYAGYLATRAAVTAVTRDAPWRPSFAWVVLCVAGMAAAVFALTRNLGLGAGAGAAAAVAVPLLGGDAYRFGQLSDARGVASMVALAGLALLARDLRSGSPRRSVVLTAGAIAGAAALVHVQYLVIVATLLVPAACVALLGRRWLGGLWKQLSLASAAAGVVMVLALPQALSFGSSSLGEAASERSLSELSALVETGRFVWPPRSVTLDVPLLYVSPQLYVLDPRALDAVWGDRTAPLLILLGAGVALVLVRKRRSDPLLLVLMLGALLVPLLVLFNPFVYPLFAKFFAPYRSEYIGFEFGFLAVGVLVSMFRHRALLAIPLVALGALTTVPVVRATQDGYDSLEAFAELMQAPEQREWREVEIDTRHGDVILAKSPLFDATGALGRRRTSKPTWLGIPSPFDPTETPERVLSRLAAQEGRVVILFSGPIPTDAPLRSLIDSGAITPVGRPATEHGIYYREVKLDREQ